ncbi:MAG: hypothetical protein ACOYVG_00280 [Bacteroidota bacterium]
MRATLLLVLSILYTVNITAQTPNSAITKVEMDRFMVDANGRILKPSGDFNEEGSPYFAREFFPGSVTILKGYTYHGLQLKINFHTNEIIFLDEKNNEMAVAQPVERVELNTPNGVKVFRSGFMPINKQDGNTFYEVLDSGNVSYLKYTEVSFSERQPYPNARFVRTYRDRVIYYIAKGSQIENVPKSIEEVLALFPGKKEKLMELIKKEKLKLKKESDMVQLFRHAKTI